MFLFPLQSCVESDVLRSECHSGSEQACLWSQADPSDGHFSTKNPVAAAVALENWLGDETGLRLRIHISQQEIQLFGIADSWSDKQRIQELVRRELPSLRIRNWIRVTPDLNGLPD